MSETIHSYWIRNKSDEEAVKLGYTFDEDAGKRVCLFIQKFCCPSQGEHAGKPIKLLPFQIDFIMRLYGWKKPNGLRRFKKAYVEIAKGNGKSALSSAIVLNHVVADDEPGPDVVCAAVDREQASLVYDESKKMVLVNPSLRKKLDVIDSRKLIKTKDATARLRAVSADANKNDGGNWNVCVVDELHRFHKRELWNVVEQAGVKRRQSLRIAITTAGEDESGPWFEERTLSEQVNRGEIINLEHLGVVYRADPEDDIHDPATWRKANPGLGYLISEEEFQASLLIAEQKGPNDLAYFKRTRLNIIESGANAFIRPEQWNACADSDLKIEDFEGCDCWLGLDLGSKLDTTALAVVFQRSDLGSDLNGLAVFVYFWLPSDRIQIREKEDKQPYRAWNKQGRIEFTDGSAVDYRAVKRKIAEVQQRFNIIKLVADPHNAQQTLWEIQDELDIEVEEAIQSFTRMNDPIKELEAQVLGKRLVHDGNPLLAFQARSTVIETNYEQKVRLAKKKSKSRIDGISAIVDAILGAVDPEADDNGPSVYEERGLLYI